MVLTQKNNTDVSEQASAVHVDISAVNLASTVSLGDAVIGSSPTSPIPEELLGSPRREGEFPLRRGFPVPELEAGQGAHGIPHHKYGIHGILHHKYVGN